MLDNVGGLGVRRTDAGIGDALGDFSAESFAEADVAFFEDTVEELGVWLVAMAVRVGCWW